MANKNDTLFEVNAGKLLATLHLAASQAIPNSIAINSGIENPQSKPNPEKPDKTTFNVNNKSGKYQLGIVSSTKTLAYRIQLDPTKDEILTKAYDEFKKAEEKDASKNDTKNESIKKIISFEEYLLTEEAENGSDKGLLDKDKDNNKDNSKDNKNAETNKNDDSKNDKKDTNDESSDDMISEDSESYKKAQDVIKEYNRYCSKCKSKKFVEFKKQLDECQKGKIEKDGKKINALQNFKALDALFQEAIKEENNERIEEKKKNIDEQKKIILEDMKKYITTFAGPENASSIKDDNCALFIADISGKAKDETQFQEFKKDFQIVVPNKIIEDLEKKHDAIFKKDISEYVEINIGYKTIFELKLETV